MSLLSGLGRAIAAAFDKNYNAVRAENEYLRQAHKAENSGAAWLPRTWGRIIASDGRTVGFSFVCACGTTYSLDGVFEWLRSYTCKACHTEFNLYRDLEINPDKMKPEDIEAALVKLPARPRAALTKPSPYVDTWAQGSAGEVQWAGDEKYAGLNGLEYSDPVAFGKHGPKNP